MTECGICISSDINGEYNEFYSSEIRKARKWHRCCECHQRIEAGSRYERASGKFDGEMFAYKTCMLCAEIRDRFACTGDYCHGDLWEAMRYEWPNFTTGCLEPRNEEQSPLSAAAKAEMLRRWRIWKGFTA